MGALIGLLIFKEKLWWKNWLGIVLAILTILFIAFA
jgi:multidrug transporter EmrE-like cation transporter